MPRTRKRPVTWIEIAVKNTGFRKASTALTWANCWAIVREVVGHDPSVEEVADWWKTPHRTAYREQATFRKAFPMLETPAKIFENPEVRAKVTKAARLAMESDAAKRAPRLPPDVGILEVGLSAATI